MADIKISSKLKKHLLLKEVKMWSMCIFSGLFISFIAFELINKS